ncbi:unannotated protein [freshwater metagenome]|uniref:Unannotated protein n=1 Tax=freshwater metagenome TaxID=449393 RepID=A0A6J7G3J6_9ZZZZ
MVWVWILDHGAHGAGYGTHYTADCQEHSVNVANAADATRDEAHPREVQERPRKAQRGTHGVLQGEFHQPPGRMLADGGSDAGLHHYVPTHTRTHGARWRIRNWYRTDSCPGSEKYRDNTLDLYEAGLSSRAPQPINGSLPSAE